MSLAFTQSLTGSRARAVAQVNDLIGDIRLRFITSIPGQDMIYLKKETEARAYLIDPDPDPLDYPFIVAEAGITAPTAYEVAQVYLNLAGQWAIVGSLLEQIRLGAVLMIETASTVAQVNAAVAQMIATIGSVFGE